MQSLFVRRVFNIERYAESLYAEPLYVEPPYVEPPYAEFLVLSVMQSLITQIFYIRP